MENYYDDKTLPCIQSVGPWWTEVDRRILFCHLMKIFQLEADYFSSLPAAEYISCGETYHLNETEIQNEFQAFLRENGKSSCPRIRNISFSFGKLNPRLCFLCPYSSTYKNQNLNDEYRFIYYLIKNKNVCLSTYIDNDKLKVENIFISHFPVYINNILVDSYPFSLIAEKFLGMSPGAFIDSQADSINQILILVHENIDKRIKYLRIKDLVMEYYPNYQTAALLAADNAMHYLEENNCNTRYAVNESLLKRLFNRLKDRKPYVTKKPYKYLCEEVSLTDPVLFESYTLKNSENEAIDNTDEKSECEKPMNGIFLDTHDKAAITENVICDNPLSIFEDDNFRSLHVLDNIIINQETSENKLSTNEVPDVIPVSPAKHDHISNQNKLFDKPNNAYELEHFKDYYTLDTCDDIFVYGSAGSENDNVILNAFIADTEYLCMEPVFYNKMTGVLMTNPSGDKLFYSIRDYGPKPLRTIADNNTPVYTSNRYYLSRHLYINKVFKLNIKDVSIAKTLLENKPVKGIKDITLTPWPDCMNKYQQLYIYFITRLSEEGCVHLHRLEKYCSLLCADGGKVPFTNMEYLCSIPHAASFDYLYNSECMPKFSGLFLYIRALIKVDSLNVDNITKTYIDICIDLDKHMPFASGNIYILRLNENGILFYIWGNDIEIQKMQLYLSACARRCFSSISYEENSVVLEEKSQIYNIRNH